MHGDLRTTSLEELCRTLDDRQASGELTIDGEGEQIRVWFRGGRVVRATASRHELRLGDRLVHGGLLTVRDLRAALRAQEGTGRHLGEILVEDGLVSRHVVRAFMQEQVLDALFAAVRWIRGSYSFEASEVSAPRVPTDLTVSQLLYALESRHRLWDEITRSVPALDRVPEFLPGADPGAVAFEPGEQAVVDAIDGERSVEELADDLGFGSYEVASIVHGLTVLGMVRLPSPAARAPDATTSRGAIPARGPEADEPAAVAAALGEASAYLGRDLNGSATPAATNGFTPAPTASSPSTTRDEAPGDDDEPHFVIVDDDLDDGQPASEPSASPALRATDDGGSPMASRPSFRAPRDEGPEPWAFVIDEGAAAEAAPGSTVPVEGPDTRQVASTSTGTPLPPPSVPVTAHVDPSGRTPGPGPAPDPTPVPDPPADVADAATSEVEEDSAPAAPPPPARARKTGEMTDLLRELRQLSDE